MDPRTAEQPQDSGAMSKEKTVSFAPTRDQISKAPDKEFKLDRPFDTPLGYWGKCKDANIYSGSVNWIKRFYPDAKSIIEVGTYTSDLLCDLSHIPYRVANDLNEDLVNFWGHVKQVKFVPGDFTKIDWSEHLPPGQSKFDVLISHCTIEHAEKPRDFAKSLMEI